MAESLIGGEDGAGWRWEQALNAFHGKDSRLDLKPVTPRDAVKGVAWLSSDHWRQPRAGGKEPVADFKVYTQTNATTFWGVGKVNYEGLKEPMDGFYANARAIIDSLLDSGNPVAKSSSFYLAAGALTGATNVLNDQAALLKAWRDKVGHKGDDFQGAGAGAFWNALDGMVFQREDIVRQMGVRLGQGNQREFAWDTLNYARGSGVDNLSTKDVLEGKAGFEWAINKLADGYREWNSTAPVGYETNTKFGWVSAPGANFVHPATALNAIWTSSRFQGSLLPSKGVYGTELDILQKGNEIKDWFPYSNLLGAGVNEGGFWSEIEAAAKSVWEQHLAATVDVHAQQAIAELTKIYQAAARHLPTIVTPRKLNLFQPKPGPPGGPEGGPPPPVPPPTPGGGSGKGDPDLKTGGGSKTPPPPPGLGGGGSGSGGPNVKEGNGKLGQNGPGPGPGPGLGLPNPNLPGGSNGPGPNSLLKAPTGSKIDPDGTVRGPDGKPLVDRLGRQVIVPPGSRINPDGEIVGPNGTKLTEKDRLARPDQSKQELGQESELDRYLKSLRDRPPTVPSLLPNLEQRSLPDLSGRSFGNGSGSSITSFGSNGTPENGSQLTVPPPSGKTVTTEGGPSLIKNQQGNGSGQNGMGGVPFYPPMAGGMGAGAGGQDQNKGERDRDTWLAEDEETWGTDPKLPPPVLGGRRRRGRAGSLPGSGAHNYGQGGNDGRLAGGAAAPGHGHAEGSA